MLTVGTLIAGRYEIAGKVGAGGMSDVYKAKDHVLERNVAIKVLKAEFSEDRNFVSKFRTEAQSAAGLEHPNIVNIYDVGSEEGMYYIVMEYVEGITLKTYIEKKGQLKFKESVSIAIQVARGIEAAHNKDIIHRDIKPQNIIISTEGKVKVTDFGIARAASANTISSDVMGSVHYASPEQARNGFVDERSDIYSLGIVMYEMITGRVPFDGETTVAVAIQHLQDDMIPPSRYAPEIPKSFEAIIQKCTQKSPERRYQNIAELLGDLRHSLSDPDGDFVVIAPLFDNGKTKVMSGEELENIRTAVREESRQELKTPPVEKKSTASTAKSTQKSRRREELEDDDLEDSDDEDDKTVLNPGMEKAVTIMGIITGIIILILIVYLVGSVAGWIKFGKRNTVAEAETQISEQVTETETEEDTVTMISIVGMNYKDATDALKKMGLTLFVVEAKESDKDKDTILTQSVNDGEQVAVGTTIKVTIAGDSLVSVPGVVGYSEDNAVSTVKSANLTPSKSYEYSSSVPAGTVISQSPESGSKASSGSTVTLVISQGRQSVNVPSVVGYSESNAKSTLSNAGFTVSVKSSYSSTVDEGLVISQSPSANKTVESGTTITITVSLGEEPKKETKSEKTSSDSTDSTKTDSTDTGSGSTTGTDSTGTTGTDSTGTTGTDSTGTTGTDSTGTTGTDSTGTTTGESTTTTQ